MNIRRPNQQRLRQTRSGQAAWLILTILTFFLFIGTLFIVYKEMDFYNKSSMWPQNNATDFMGKISGFFDHRTGDVQPYVPIKSRPDPEPIIPIVPAPVDGDADATDTNDTEEVTEEPEPIAVP